MHFYQEVTACSTECTEREAKLKFCRKDLSSCDYMYIGKKVDFSPFFQLF